ncbi:MAG: hypothetical protein AAFY84_08335 [Pseudomonadota bacterium]
MDERTRSKVDFNSALCLVVANQSKEQKLALTEEFLKICPTAVAGTDYDLLEEPLATAWGDAACAKYGQGKPIDSTEEWYRRALPDVLARLIWLRVDADYETDKTITDGIVEEAARNCTALLETQKTLRRKSGWPFWNR